VSAEDWRRGYRLDARGIRFNYYKGKLFLFLATFRLVLAPTQLPIKWVSEAVSLGREAGPSALSSARLRIRGTTSPLRLLHVLVLYRTQGQLQLNLVMVS
jgi:hypothetical protein